MSTLKTAIPAGILALCSTAASAIPLTISGVYNGNINGIPIAATSTGTLDTAGPGGSMTIDFASIDNGGFSPMALGSSFITLVCWSSAAKLDGGALNLFDLSGGNYVLNRRFTWDGLGGSEILVSANIALVGSTLQYTVNMNGTYAGPVDITAINNYVVQWTQGPMLQVDELGEATLIDGGGGSTGLNIESQYQGLSSAMLRPQEGNFFPVAHYAATGPTSGLFQVDWTAHMRSLVPEPATLSLLLPALLPLLRRRRGPLATSQYVG